MDPQVSERKTISRQMPLPSVDRRASEERRKTNTRIFTGSVIVIAVLYAARQVLVPIALAILFSFVLRPIVSLFQYVRIKRTIAIAIALALTVSILGLGTWYLTIQANMLAKEVAAYSGNLEKKMRFVTRSTGTIALFERTLERIASSTDRTESADLKVRVVERKSIGDRYRAIAPPAEFVASAFLVIVLVFFMLHDSDQLRDKLLRLAGRANLTVTTQALGEVSHRISRYLFTFAMLNLIFGCLVGIGLSLIGLPHAALWGVLGGLLRFIPYIGAIISAGLPTILALAFFPSWWSALAVLALFVILDQVMAGFVEPLVIGHRIGVSPIALLVSAIFWGWLWGPVGLLLATPISLCLTVAGEFIPALRVFSILFGTEAPLDGYLTFYNRLLLRDRPGAIAIADRYAEETTMESTFNDLFIPTLTFAAEELAAGRINRASDHLIKDVTREVIHHLGDRNAEYEEDAKSVVAVSVANERLSLGTMMLIQLLRAAGYRAETFTDLTDEEVVAFVEEIRAEAIFVSCSNQKNLEAGYALLQLLANTFPDLFVVAGGSAFAATREATLRAGASYVPEVLAEAKEYCLKEMKKPRRRWPPAPLRTAAPS